MKERHPPPSLEELDRRLKRARQRRADDDRAAERKTGVGFAFRIGTELIAGIAIGVGLGWLLDEWLGTRPWLMVLFFFLGSGAGMMNVYRTMRGLGHGVGYKPRADDER